MEGSWDDFSANFDRRQTNLLVYVKYLKSACLPYLLFDAEVFCLSASLLDNLNNVSTG